MERSTPRRVHFAGNPKAPSHLDFQFMSHHVVQNNMLNTSGSPQTHNQHDTPSIAATMAGQSPFVNLNDKAPPWNHLFTRAAPEDASPRMLPPHNTRRQSFGSYRELGKDDTESIATSLVASDSGYGTGPTSFSLNSGESGTIGTDCTEIIDPLNSFHTYGPDNPGKRTASQVDATENPQQPDLALPPAQRLKPSLECPTCGHKARLQSELKKHRLKHDKPHVCGYQGCTRTKGFTTSNDLDRHRMSKHRLFFGVKTFYKCVHPACAHRTKEWCRRDNFCQHVTRTHDGVDKAELVQASGFNVHGQLTEPQLFTGGLSEFDLHPNQAMGSQFFQNQVVQPDATPVVDLAPQNYPTVGWNQSVQATESSPFNTLGRLDSGFDSSFAGISSFQNENASAAAQQNLSSSYGSQGLSLHSGDKSALGNTSYRRQASRSVPDYHTRNLATTNPSRSCAESQRTSAKSILPVVLHQNDQDYKDCKEAKDRSQLMAEKLIAGMQQCNDMDEQLEAVVEFIQENFESLRPNPSFLSASAISSISSENEDVFKTARHELNRGLKESHSDQEEQTSGSEPSDRNNEPKSPSSTPKPVSRTDTSVKCDHCDKVGRRCDMKKHMRRHTKPFGCTFQDCYKVFGSKNDWKRHENSQHFLNDQWRCHLPQCAGKTSARDASSSDSAVNNHSCAKLFHRKEIFVKHLRRKHEFTNEAKISQECSRSHLCTNGQRRFWCGFCHDSVRIHKRGSRAWDERFDHITKHFLDEGKHVDDWYIERGNCKKGRLRKLAFVGKETLSDDDEDDDSGDEDLKNGGSSSSDYQEHQEPAMLPGERENFAPSGATPLPFSYCCQCLEGPHLLDLYDTCRNESCNHRLCRNCTRSQQLGCLDGADANG